MKYGHNIVSIKRQFKDENHRKLYRTTVYIIVFGRLGDCDHRYKRYDVLHNDFHWSEKWHSFGQLITSPFATVFPLISVLIVTLVKVKDSIRLSSSTCILHD